MICPLQHAGGNCQTNLFCRLKVNDEFKLRRLLHRQISRFGTFQDLVHVNSRTTIEITEVRPIGHETAVIDIFLSVINGGQPVFADKLDNARAILMDLRREGARVWDRFNGGIQSVWYYRELVCAFREAGGGPIVDELDVVVTDIERLAGRTQTA